MSEFFLLLADTAVRTPEQKRAWLVTMILGLLVVFLILLFGLMVVRFLHRGRRPQMMGGATTAGSIWEASAERLKIPATEDGARPADGPMDLADEPFWDAEEEAGIDEPEDWTPDDDDDEDEDDIAQEGDEPWR